LGTQGWVVTSLGSGNAAAAEVTVTPDNRIFVVGGSNGNFALVRYNINGSLDRNFGTSGVVTTDFGAIDGALAIHVSSDGRLTAAGSSINQGRLVAARYLLASATVEITGWDTRAAERGTDGASFIFTRSQRLSFPTRIYYSVSGTALPVSDYIGMPASSNRWVDIPA
jgi:hypothetical protein